MSSVTFLSWFIDVTLGFVTSESKELFSIISSLFELCDVWLPTNIGLPYFDKQYVVLLLRDNSFFKYSIWSSNDFNSTLLSSRDGVGSEYPVFVLDNKPKPTC